MFKKFIGIIIIIAMIVGLAYLKTFMDNQRNQSYLEQGKSDSILNLAQSQNNIDSLNLAIAEKDIEQKKSLQNQDKSHQVQVDSLEKVVNKQAKQITDLKKKKKTTTTAKKSASKQTLSKHEKVYTYYKKRFAALPQDLSEYEKKVAMNEIRDETADKFKISLTELWKIRQKYKLNY